MDTGNYSSDAVRLSLMRVADAKHLPFEAKVPNAKSHLAMCVFVDGKGRRSASAPCCSEAFGRCCHLS
jgi:antitoxin component of RelBE/YafQ-DinJ toxin-antitoxin module